jgi:hypothetical protein
MLNMIRCHRVPTHDGTSLYLNSETWPSFPLGGLFFRPSVHAGANECGSFAPILLRLVLGRWCRRILALDPVPEAAGAVGRAKALRYDASGDDGDTYEGVTCLACAQVNIVDPKTGKVLGAEEE